MSNHPDSAEKTQRRIAFYLGSLTAFTALVALYVARGFLIPLVLALLTAYLLRPIVRRLQSFHVPRPLGAALALAAVIGVVALAVVSSSDNVETMLADLPDTAHELRLKLRPDKTSDSPLRNVQKAANELEAAALTAAGSPLPATPPAAVPRSGVQQYLLAQSALLMSTIAQLPVILLLVYFLLISEDYFRREVPILLGAFLEKREVLDMLHEIDVQIQNYMLVMVGSNLLIGIATWLSFWALGMEHPALWGIAAGILHFIPYLGTALVAGGAAGAAYLKSGTMPYALEVTAVFLVVASLIGMGFMTWLQGRYAKINAALLFIGLLFFAWLWGMWGLLLGAPLISILKVAYDRMRASMRRHEKENTPIVRAAAVKNGAAKKPA